MYLKLLKNDFRKNPWNNAILLLFLCLSSAVAVTVTLMLDPPHFLQMHKGELSQAAKQRNLRSAAFIRM